MATTNDKLPQPEPVYDLLTQTYAARTESPEQLFALMYDELRRVARAYMARERADHTLGATALLNECYLKLFGGAAFDWSNRQQLFCTVTRSMRRLLVDHARKVRSKKHGGEIRKVVLDAESRGPAIVRDLPMLLALDEAINRLSVISP